MMTGTSIIMYNWVNNVDQYNLMIILQLKMLEAKQNVAALKHLQNPSDKNCSTIVSYLAIYSQKYSCLLYTSPSPRDA